MMDEDEHVEGRSDGEESDYINVKVETDVECGGESQSSSPEPLPG